jgi:hypothetical protein
MPNYHLRQWLLVSPLHRDIASRHIFHTIDIYFEEEDVSKLNRGLDILDRAKNDPVFASRVKLLRLHWDYERGLTLDLIIRTWLPLSHSVAQIVLQSYRFIQDFSARIQSIAIL